MRSAPPGRKVQALFYLNYRWTKLGRLSIMPAKFVQILRFSALWRELIYELFEPKNLLPGAVQRGEVRFYRNLKNR
jgi:hypothetical protein